MKAKPGTVSGVRAQAALLRGINQMVAVVRPTLGPRSRLVALERIGSSAQAPELLDDGATIVRRIVEIADRDADMGAMLIRHAMWRVHETVGDGSVTTAVLFGAALKEGLRLVAAGYNPMRLRNGMERALEAACKQLRCLSSPLEGQEAISQMATMLCDDAEMATLLGEIFDIVGWEGAVEVRDSKRRGLEREYVEGAFWDNGWLSSGFVKDMSQPRVELQDAAVLISDLDFSSAEHLVPLLEKLAAQGTKALFVIARDVSGSALALLLNNLQRGTFQSLAVKYPSYGELAKGFLADIATLTGGRVLTMEGDSPARVSIHDLGRARLVWANRQNFGLVGGQGDARTLRGHIAHIRSQLRMQIHKEGQKPEEDAQAQLRQRLGKLMGGVGILYVGGATELEVNVRKALAERTVIALRSAIEGGVVPGGGSSLLACQPVLDGLINSVAVDSEERAGMAVVRRALEEPLRAIAENAGYEASAIAAQVRAAPAGWGLDVRTGQVGDLRQAGVWDATQTVEVALRTAMSGATLALTTQTLVHSRKPVMMARP